MKFPALWSGLVSRVGASHRVNLMHLSPLEKMSKKNYCDELSKTPADILLLKISSLSLSLAMNFIFNLYKILLLKVTPMSLNSF